MAQINRLGKSPTTTTVILVNIFEMYDLAILEFGDMKEWRQYFTHRKRPFFAHVPDQKINKNGMGNDSN